MRKTAWIGMICTLSFSAVASGQQESAPPARAARRGSETWRRPFAPFKVIGNIYFVGTEGLGVYLIATPEGHILLDTGLADTVRWTRDSIEKLGFNVADIKYMISSHAHYDHVEGHPQMHEWSGAKVWAMQGDAEVIAGGRTPTKVDRILQDGDKLILGGVTLTANWTPGHTKGDTTWTVKVDDGGKTYDVVFFGSTTILNKLLGNANYPNMPDDYEKAYAKLKSLPCDVFLAPHGNFFGMEEKAAKLQAGASPNPFIDPQGYRDYIDKAERDFRAQLAKEKAEAAKVPAQ